MLFDTGGNTDIYTIQRDMSDCESCSHADINYFILIYLRSIVKRAMLINVSHD